jgi:hypothetical protein
MCLLTCPAPAAYKQQAIQGLGMGTENRVAMLFDQAGRGEGCQRRRLRQARCWLACA